MLCLATGIHKRFWAVVGCSFFLAGCATSAALAPGTQYAADPQRITYIDTHVHLDGIYRMRGVLQSDFGRAADTALEAMNSLGIQKSLIMPQPFPPNHPLAYDYGELAGVIKKNRERFAFLGGGGTLNGMIQESVRSGQLTPDLRRKFEEKATEILRGGAVGFGELTAEHLSFHPGHPYEAAPPDHPLFLLLADIAARHDVPIDLHMEALPRDMPLPPRFASPPNPRILRENLAAFERLLAHNRQARIVWAHAGSDSTGHRTVSLMRRLLEAHPNLFMQVKVDQVTVPRNRALNENGEIRPEWIELIRSFPDRFILGSDGMYGIPGLTLVRPAFAQGPRAFLDQLPPDLARKVGYENAVSIYRLK